MFYLFLTQFHLLIISFKSPAGGRADSILARGGAAQADHRPSQGHVGSFGGRSVTWQKPEKRGETIYDKIS